MRSLALAVGAAIFALPLSAAKAQVWTLGGPLSRVCYESALARDARQFNLEGCNRALAEENLTVPDRAATLVNRGILRMIKGADPDADADFNAALSLDQGLADAWLNKGFLRLREDRGRDALPLIEKGIKLGPQRPALAILGRGLAYEQIGDLKAAYADLTKARELEPGWSLPGQYLARYQVRSR